MEHLGFVGEAPADFRTGSRLADRVLCTHVDWIEDNVLDSYREWSGVEANSECLLWRRVKTVAQEKNIRAHGKFGGAAGQPDARTARLALLLFNSLETKPSAVVLMRDTDCDARRLSGLSQAREARAWPFEVVLGAADPKRECWVLAGFDAEDDTEEQQIKSLRNELGFNPSTQAQELTAIRAQDKKSAKRVLGLLTANSQEREARCIEADLDLLAIRGRETGLGSFLKEVEDRVVPLFDPSLRPG